MMADEKVGRRDFMSKIGIWSFGATILASVAGTVRYLFPEAFAEPSTKVKIGGPENFSIASETRLDDAKVYVFRDDEGIYVISAICTHLGCIVMKNETGFLCPCHGSRFDTGGKVQGGPAPASLPWLEVTTAPDGQLVVDTARHIAPGTKYIV